MLSFEEGLILIFGLSASRELPGGRWTRGAWSYSPLGWWVLVASSGETVFELCGSGASGVSYPWTLVACLKFFVDNP